MSPLLRLKKLLLKRELNKMGNCKPERKQLYLAYLAELCYLPNASHPLQHI